MRIKLLSEWMGNQPQSILDLVDSKARELVHRGCAYVVDEKSSPPKKEPLYEEKEVEEPSSHKMVLKKKVTTK